MSPNLSTGDAEEMFYLTMLAMYSRAGFLEDVERIYDKVMSRNYGW
jgi:pentatricopeptide repeat protein